MLFQIRLERMRLEPRPRPHKERSPLLIEPQLPSPPPTERPTRLRPVSPRCAASCAQGLGEEATRKRDSCARGLDVTGRRPHDTMHSRRWPADTMRHVSSLPCRAVYATGEVGRQGVPSAETAHLGRWHGGRECCSLWAIEQDVQGVSRLLQCPQKLPQEPSSSGSRLTQAAAEEAPCCAFGSLAVGKRLNAGSCRIVGGGVPFIQPASSGRCSVSR